MATKPDFPRRCEIHGDQFFAEGMCYGLGINPKGEPFVLFEDDTGHVHVFILGLKWVKLAVT